MENKEAKLIIKILGLIGAIFVLIAQFVPWGGGAYLFAANLGISWDFFYIQVMSTGIWQAILLGVVMIIIFFLNLVAIIFSFLSFKRIETKGSNAYLMPAILVTVEFILYIIGAGTVGSIGLIGIGFVMILIAMIMLYLAFGLGKILGISATPMMYQQPTYQPTQYQQPQMMYTTAQQPPPAVQQIPVQQQAPPPVQTQPARTTTRTKTGPRFCPQCGLQLQINANFCPVCGNKM